MDWKNVKKWKNRGSKYIRHLNISTLTQPKIAKYVHLLNLLKHTGTGHQIFETFT